MHTLLTTTPRRPMSPLRDPDLDAVRAAVRQLEDAIFAGLRDGIHRASGELWDTIRDADDQRLTNAYLKLYHELRGTSIARLEDAFECLYQLTEPPSHPGSYHVS